ncbi:hypothetical protein HA052_08185 [Chromobacterium haemolyticum]|uniref:Phage tail collar domain-containing protein n=1 Tax=Chromobacterium fluminis TaxID=3044269 RepID=A0ABX0LCU5_9NEIS|nr:tail fiber protein [Chromobacterium haemolyticum]NHR05177.1 hypothetical protein [Chromobacterium haemolyticum]
MYSINPEKESQMSNTTVCITPQFQVNVLGQAETNPVRIEMNQCCCDDGANSGASVPSGAIQYFARKEAPAGWIKADGSLVSKQQYASLYQAIGDMFANKEMDTDIQALLKFDDRNKLIDLISGKEAVLVGTANLSTEQSKFGKTSLQTKAKGNYARFTVQSKFNPDAFTIEGWHYPMFTGHPNWIFGMNASAPWGEIGLGIHSQTKAPMVWLAGPGSGFICEGVQGQANAFPEARWYHIALCYDGATYRLFVDGKLAWSLKTELKVNIPDNTIVFSVDGHDPIYADSAGGYFQDWMISKKCRYQAEFTPPGEQTGSSRPENTELFQLPDLRGEFIRGWDDGRKVDAGRVLGSAQASTQALVDDDVALAVGVIDRKSNNLLELGYEPATSSSVQVHKLTPSGQAVGDAQSLRSIRPRNLALLACIKA